MFRLRKKKKETTTIASPPDINFAHETIRRRVDASLQKEEKTFLTFQVWLSHFISDCISNCIEKDLSQYISFNIEIKKNGICGTEYGTIFRRFYEQNDSYSSLSFSQDLLSKMKEWILGDFSIMYVKAGYRVVVSENRFEISWAQAKSLSNKVENES